MCVRTGGITNTLLDSDKMQLCDLEQDNWNNAPSSSSNRANIAAAVDGSHPAEALQMTLNAFSLQLINIPY
jgi:hypothetical protein